MRLLQNESEVWLVQKSQIVRLRVTKGAIFGREAGLTDGLAAGPEREYRSENWLVFDNADEARAEALKAKRAEIDTVEHNLRRLRGEADSLEAGIEAKP